MYQQSEGYFWYVMCPLRNWSIVPSIIVQYNYYFRFESKKYHIAIK